VIFHVFSNAAKYSRKGGDLAVEVRFVSELFFNPETGIPD
jgi:hypothetical protein